MSSSSQASSPQEDYGSITHLCTELGYPEGASKASGSLAGKAVNFRKAFMGEDELPKFPTSHLDPLVQRCASEFLIKHARLFTNTPLVYPDNVDKLRDWLAKLMCAQQLKYLTNKDYNDSKKRDREDRIISVGSKLKRQRVNPLKTAGGQQASQFDIPIDLTDEDSEDSFPSFGLQNNPNSRRPSPSPEPRPRPEAQGSQARRINTPEHTHTPQSRHNNPSLPDKQPERGARGTSPARESAGIPPSGPASKAARRSRTSKPNLTFILEDEDYAPDEANPLQSSVFRSSTLREFFDIFCKRSGRDLGSVDSLTFNYGWAKDSFTVDKTDDDASWEKTKRTVEKRFNRIARSTPEKTNFQIDVAGPDADGWVEFSI
ncbi:hypothetical protein BDZ45DRAFT_801392 [Acephala macrosclerotiorum]|nr:hypothetical protein BDZ45DRAFT_801392 [Acephala macrosclerotiorum]